MCRNIRVHDAFLTRPTTGRLCINWKYMFSVMRLLQSVVFTWSKNAIRRHRQWGHNDDYDDNVQESPFFRFAWVVNYIIICLTLVQLFQRIRDECPLVLRKVTAVHGDITMEALGLTAATRQTICERAQIVYHLAATLKLEATLKDAIEMNLNGTRRVLELCGEMQQLQQMLHLSTAFCNCDQAVMEERVYGAQHRPEDVLQVAGWMDERVMAGVTKDLVRPHVNAYTYSKRLAEILVQEQYPRLPVAIVRPSIGELLFKLVFAIQIIALSTCSIARFDSTQLRVWKTDRNHCFVKKSGCIQLTQRDDVPVDLFGRCIICIL